MVRFELAEKPGDFAGKLVERRDLDAVAEWVGFAAGVDDELPFWRKINARMGSALSPSEPKLHAISRQPIFVRRAASGRDFGAGRRSIKFARRRPGGREIRVRSQSSQLAPAIGWPRISSRVDRPSSAWEPAISDVDFRGDLIKRFPTFCVPGLQPWTREQVDHEVKVGDNGFAVDP